MNLIKETLDNWLGRDGLVVPQVNNSNSGNEILYSCVFIALADALDYRTDRVYLLIEPKLKACQKTRGLYMRTPDGSYGLQSWDDYLGLAVVFLIMGDTQSARDVLWFGLTHLGFYNNTDKFTWSAWLWRFPHVWVVMWVAAFPWMRYPLYPLIALVGMFMDWKTADESGTQLQWMYFYACKKMGFKFQKYDRLTEVLPLAFSRYYSNSEENRHPFIEAAKELKARMNG